MYLYNFYEHYKFMIYSSFIFIFLSSLYSYEVNISVKVFIDDFYDFLSFVLDLCSFILGVLVNLCTLVTFRGDFEVDFPIDFSCDFELSLLILLTFCLRTLENYIYYEMRSVSLCVEGMLGVKLALVLGVLAELLSVFLFYLSLF